VTTSESVNGGHNLPFAKEVSEAADRLRGSVESAEYKHLVLGLLFLKYISDSFRAAARSARLDRADGGSASSQGRRRACPPPS